MVELQAKAQAAAERNGIAVAPTTSAADLLAETMAQKLADAGVADSQSLAQAIVRWVKDLYYRTAMAVQRAFGAEPDMDLALNWFENQLRRETGGDFDYRLASLLDRFLAVPMVEQVVERTGSTPGQWLVDGGFPAHEQIDAVHEQTQGMTEVLAPVPEPRRKSGDDDTPPTDKHQRKEGDTDAVAQWRQRMAGDEAKELYKQRAATAECVNALARNRGLQRMPVRGLTKVRAVAYLYALAHNLMRMVKIAPQLLGLGTGASVAAAAVA
jgi:hypothetical protein